MHRPDHSGRSEQPRGPEHCGLIYSIALLALIGACGGITGGMFGVGGSVVMIPALNEALGPNQHLYQAACMIVNVFVAGPAILQHHRAGAIDRDLVVRLIPLTAVAMLAGVGISELPVFAGPGEAYLRGIFGLFLILVSLQELRHAAFHVLHDTVTVEHEQWEPSTKVMKQNSVAPHPAWRNVALVALPTGLLGGLLGVGGGLVAVPLQHRWLRIPIRTAIANSAGVIVVTSLVGAVAKNLAYMRDTGGSLKPIGLALILIPAAMFGSTWGSRWVHRLPVRWIKVGFFLLMLAAALRLVWKAFGPPLSKV